MNALDLRTPRLVLRPLTASDTAPLHQLWTAPGVRRYLWDDEIVSPERTAGVVEESQRLFARSEYGIWGAHRLEDDALAGFGGFWFFRDPPELELIYGVDEAHWRRGLATEIARALLAYAIDRLGWDVIRASTDVPNVASSRVLEKLGFTHERDMAVNGRDTSFFRYSTKRIVPIAG